WVSDRATAAADADPGGRTGPARSPASGAWFQRPSEQATIQPGPGATNDTIWSGPSGASAPSHLVIVGACGSGVGGAVPTFVTARLAHELSSVSTAGSPPSQYARLSPTHPIASSSPFETSITIVLAGAPSPVRCRHRRSLTACWAAASAFAVAAAKP